MYAETQKLHLIEEILKIESDAVLTELETILIKSKAPHSIGFKPFISALSSEEIDELERNIKEGCEQINQDDWK